METTTNTSNAVERALTNDPRAKAWMTANLPLFENSTEHEDMFLTTYRFRNAYEDLLNRLELGERIWDERDRLLVQRWFEMAFYPPRSLSLSQWKNGVDPIVRIEEAFKDRRWRANGKRPFEITLKLDDGKEFQINPNDILVKFLVIKSEFQELLSSDL